MAVLARYEREITLRYYFRRMTSLWHQRTSLKKLKGASRSRLRGDNTGWKSRLRLWCIWRM
jgi:hypothetical protein